MSRSHPENLSETPDAPRTAQCNGGLLRVNVKAYLDGEMSAVRSGLVRWHLAQCTECREELRWLRRLGEDMKDIESAHPRPELRARILANLPNTPPAPGIRVVHSRQDRARTSAFMPRLALASSLAMLLTFSAVFAMKHAAGKASARDVVSHPSRSTPSGEAAEIAFAKDSTSMVMETITYAPPIDPNNALADRMFHQQMADMEREKRVQGQDDWPRLLAQARAAAHKTDSTGPSEMGVTLAVPNIVAMRAHLPTWAKQEGVRLVTAGRPVFDDAAPITRTEEAAGNMVAFYVPVERGASFLGALKQLGRISILPLSPSRMAANTPQAGITVHMDANPDKQPKVVPLMPTVADSGTPTEKAAPTLEKPTKTARYLVLTVLLQSAPHN
jgi:hypothetical protein